MFLWRRRGREHEDGPRSAPLPRSSRNPEGDAPRTPPGEPSTGAVRPARDEPRPAAIQRIAQELEGRGARVVGLSEEVVSPRGRAVLPIRLRSEPEGDVFVEVVTGPWDGRTVQGLLRSVAVLRGSGLAGAALEVLSAYPAPDEVGFFSRRSAAALFQLDLFERDDEGKPQACAEAFVEAAARHWGLKLDYDPEGLPAVEDRLLATLGEGAEEETRNPPILDALVRCLGCYVGETLRRRAPSPGSWSAAADWGEGLVLEFGEVVADPIGKTRAFLHNGTDDSLAFYVTYALQELGAQGDESEVTAGGG